MLKEKILIKLCDLFDFLVYLVVKNRLGNYEYHKKTDNVYINNLIITFSITQKRCCRIK